MSSYDFDSFKQHLREWMDSHSGEYDAFETGMNRRDDAGYQMILAVAMTVAPEYEKILNKPNLVGSLSGHKEGSKAFACYREIDEQMKRELVDLLK